LASKNFPTKSPESLPSGKIWPTGEFSFGWVKQRPDERLDSREVTYCPPGWFPGDGGFEPGESWLDSCRAAALDLSNLPNSVKNAKRPETYGRQGITGYGKKVVKSVGALIDSNLPLHRVTFATITMPSLHQQLRRQLALAWPELVTQLLRWISRRLEKKGLPKIVVSASEVQPKRLSESGEAYLHLHLLWVNSPGRRGNWAVNVLHLRAWVSDFLIRRGLWAADSHVNVDTRGVKGDKACYLAKYLSKGGDIIADAAKDIGWDALPSQWWNVTKTARDWVKRELVAGKAVGYLLHEMVNAAFNLDRFADFRYLYQVETEIDGFLLNVGWRGCLTPESYIQCKDLFRELDSNALTSQS
jgi:hypothetical protein